MRARYVMTRKRFRAWLESLNPRAEVRRAKYGSACPLENYLRDKGYPNATVGCFNWSLHDRPTSELELPIWAVRFTERVDFHKPRIITAKRALQLLAAA